MRQTLQPILISHFTSHSPWNRRRTTRKHEIQAPRRHLAILGIPAESQFFTIPMFSLARTGIEPVRPITGPGILSPVRLPVSPPGRDGIFDANDSQTRAQEPQLPKSRWNGNADWRNIKLTDSRIGVRSRISARMSSSPACDCPNAVHSISRWALALGSTPLNRGKNRGLAPGG